MARSCVPILLLLPALIWVGASPPTPTRPPAATQAGAPTTRPSRQGAAGTVPSTQNAIGTAATQPSDEIALVIKQAQKLRDESRFLMAEKMLRGQIDKLARGGPERASVSTASCKRVLAMVLADQGQEAEAEAFAIESYAEMKEVFPPDVYPVGSEERARSAWVLGNILMRSGRTEPAEPVLLEALYWFEANRSSHWETPMLASDVGECLLQQGRFAEAEDPIVIGYAELRRMRGPDAFETLKALERVFALYKSWDKPEKVAEYESLISEVPARKGN
ncbi:MAG: hypothetical protein DCC65_05305 [Planctomycetota bacterium]|nr:MAG: hypothetical protein DCC65_05305 [Planctomycetota bacterium]